MKLHDLCGKETKEFGFCCHPAKIQQFSRQSWFRSKIFKSNHGQTKATRKRSSLLFLFVFCCWCFSSFQNDENLPENVSPSKRGKGQSSVSQGSPSKSPQPASKKSDKKKKKKKEHVDGNLFGIFFFFVLKYSFHSRNCQKGISFQPCCCQLDQKLPRWQNKCFCRTDQFSHPGKFTSPYLNLCHFSAVDGTKFRFPLNNSKGALMSMKY